MKNFKEISIEYLSKELNKEKEFYFPKILIQLIDLNPCRIYDGEYVTEVEKINFSPDKNYKHSTIRG